MIEGAANYKVTDLDSPAYDKGQVIDLADEENRDHYTR